jgi:hypothetical protein
MCVFIVAVSTADVMQHHVRHEIMMNGNLRRTKKEDMAYLCVLPTIHRMEERRR